MKFDKSKVYSTANADQAKPGSTGYFADNFFRLKKKVESEQKDFFGMLEHIDPYDEEPFSFKNEPVSYELFYLVEESEEKK